MRSRLSRLLVAVAVAGTLGACKQGVGERCQLDSDCDTGHCAVAGGMLGVGGTCSSGDVTTGVDLSVTTPVDQSVLDAPAADLVPTDLTSTDQASASDGAQGG